MCACITATQNCPRDPTQKRKEKEIKGSWIGKEKQNSTYRGSFKSEFHMVKRPILKKSTAFLY